MPTRQLLFTVALLMTLLAFPWHSQAGSASANLPLDSPVYTYLEKLAGLGLIRGDILGIRPYSKAEAARLVLEAGQNQDSGTLSVADASFSRQLIALVRAAIPREVARRESPETVPDGFTYSPVASLRMRTLWLDGTARDFRRPVHDPGNDGVFGIGSGLRPRNPDSAVVMQRGSEGTPLIENNNGVRYGRGANAELRWGAEAYLDDRVTLLLEPQLLASSGDVRLQLNRAYLKLGGGGLELEAGRDENWLGPGYRGAITLTNNAENFLLLKLSSPEPLDLAWLKRWVGDVKYTLIASRFEHTTTAGVERQPWFYAVKLSVKPQANLEIGFNLGRQVGGPGVSNSFENTLRGLIGGTSADNSNGLAGLDLRYRLAWLRNAELYGEFSGEDTAAFWPIVESYLAGLYLPRLSDDGRNDLRFEFFQGNQILYTNGTFPGGYLYKNMPIGHSQGGATQDFFCRGSHWFSPRNRVALEYSYTNRGMVSRVAGQAIERKHAGRLIWSLPLADTLDAQLGYGIELVSNYNLVADLDRSNQLLKFELRYRY